MRLVFQAIILTLSMLLLTGCMSPGEWWHRVQKKAKDLYTLKIRHEMMEKQYNDLKVKHLTTEYELHNLSAEKNITAKKEENIKHAGHEEGRHLANINYTSPKNLSFEEKYNLALDHVGHGNFSEAFVLFESFLWIPEAAAFQTVSALYNAGISSYQIKNYNRAIDYFEAVNAHADSIKDAEYVRRTKLWLKVIDQNPEVKRKVASH